MRFICVTCIYLMIARDSLGVQHNWTECVPDEFSDPIYVHELLISPLPVHLPGSFNISFDAVVTDYAPELVIDVQIGVKNTSTNVTEHVYPLDEEYLRVFEGCLLINKLLFNDYTRIEQDIDIQIDRLYNDALHYHAGCPLLTNRITFASDISLPVDLISFNALPKGTYVVNIEFKSRASGSETFLGCVETAVDYVGHIIN